MFRIAATFATLTSPLDMRTFHQIVIAVLFIVVPVASSYAMQPEVVHSLGQFDGLKAQQFKRGIFGDGRTCQTFTNLVLVKAVDGNPFVSPQRPGLRETANEIADALVDQCLGDGERVQIVDLYTVIPDSGAGSGETGNEVIPLAKIEGIGRQRSFQIADTAIQYLQRQRNLGTAEELGCKTGQVTYTGEASANGWGQLPAHWSGELEGARRKLNESGPFREFAHQGAAKMQVTDDGRPLLSFELGVKACELLLIPEGKGDDIINANERSFQVKPRGDWACDSPREALADGGQVRVQIATLDDQSLQLEYSSRTVENRWGTYETEQYSGRLTPAYPSCVPERTAEQKRRDMRIAAAYLLLLGSGARQAVDQALDEEFDPYGWNLCYDALGNRNPWCW